MTDVRITIKNYGQVDAWMGRISHKDTVAEHEAVAYRKIIAARTAA